MVISLGIDMDKSFDIVHKSNMSKLCTSEQEAIDTVTHYTENDTRYNSPFYYQSKLSDNHYIIKNKSTGKVLKSVNYNAVDFTEYLS